MTVSIATYLKYANLQMAAESLFGIQPIDIAGKTSLTMNEASLKDGNNRASKFTQVQADQFIADGWTVVEHKSNTATGFSGTLFKNSSTGKLVLSFRSTEFLDDSARDNQATNSMEIKPFGWAFGQIADMENWYASLKSRQLIGQQKVAVTGYSLGGHLATVFNLLNAGAAERVVTFNGAGVGLVKDGTLQDALNEFNELRTSPDLLAARFTHPGLATFYRRLQAELASGQTTVAQAQADLNALYTDAHTGVMVPITLAGGQTDVGFSIVNSADLDANVDATLTAKFTSTGGASTSPVASSNSATLSLKDTGEATRRVTHRCCWTKNGMKLIAACARPTGATGHKYLKTSSMEIA